MIREALSHLHWSALPIVSMLMFMSVFLGAVLWSYRKGANDLYRKMSLLPLEKGDQYE